jgi:hypothetical protein
MRGLACMLAKPLEFRVAFTTAFDVAARSALIFGGASAAQSEAKSRTNKGTTRNLSMQSKVNYPVVARDSPLVI